MLEEEFNIKKSLFLVKGGLFLSFKFTNSINLTFRVQMIIVNLLDQNFFILFSPCNFIAPYMYIILNCMTIPVFN
jgi:hypothetical protein